MWSWRFVFVVFVFILGSRAPAWSQAGAWKDLSPHRARLVPVDDHVRLEVLDWGGSGRALVLLAGGGNTAHVFDDFAPMLTGHNHVYGITRRGFGASEYAETVDPGEQFGRDILAVVDGLKLDRPVLVGHSLGGAELSWMANAHPDRIAGVVYLDAGYSYAFDNGKGTPVREMMGMKAPDPPSPGTADLASFTALQRYWERVDGFKLPEAELRAQRETNGDGSVGGYRNLPGGQVLQKLIDGGPKFTKIPVPALFIFANPHGLGPWVDANESARRAARSFSEGMTRLTAKQVKAVEEGLPEARVIVIRNAHHFVFLSNETEVLRDMAEFFRAVR